MAEINITPPDGSRWSASIHKKAIFKPDTDAEVPVLVMHFGSDHLRIWPTSWQQIVDLSEDLRAQADLWKGKIP